MNSAKKHYDQHLGAIYSWMARNENAALEQNRSLFRQMALDVASKGLAIDLGCGTGVSVDSTSGIWLFGRCYRFLRRVAIPIARTC